MSLKNGVERIGNCVCSLEEWERVKVKDESKDLGKQNKNTSVNGDARVLTPNLENSAGRAGLMFGTIKPECLYGDYYG